MLEITGLEGGNQTVHVGKKRKVNDEYVGSLASRRIELKPGVLLREFANTSARRKNQSAADAVPTVRTGGEYVPDYTKDYNAITRQSFESTQ